MSNDLALVDPAHIVRVLTRYAAEATQDGQFVPAMRLRDAASLIRNAYITPSNIKDLMGITNTQADPRFWPKEPTNA